MKKKVQEVLRPKRDKLILGLFLFLGISGIVEFLTAKSGNVLFGLSREFGFPLSIFQEVSVDCGGLTTDMCVKTELSVIGISLDLIFWYGIGVLGYEGVKRWKR